MNEDEAIQYRMLQTKVAQAEANTARMQQAAVTMFSGEENDNLIKWQLDLEKSLLRIERLLRKQVPTRDEKGNIYYKDCKENQLFNEYGINEILNTLSWYVNKEIILSYYEPEQIDLIMMQFGEEIIDFIYTNMEKFGLDNDEKKKHFPLVTMNIINLVDATYRRAVYGHELESLKTARIVNQTEPLGKPFAYPQINKQRSFNLLKPSTWKA